MANWLVYVALAACLCLAEGATLSDLHAAINREANRLRVNAILEVQLTGIGHLQSDGLSSEEAACVRTTNNLTVKELNEAIIPVQYELRGEIPTYWASILPGLTVEELDAEVRERLEDAVHSVVKRLLKRIKKCI